MEQRDLNELIDRPTILGYSGGMIFLVPDWENFRLLFPEDIGMYSLGCLIAPSLNSLN